MIAKHQDPEYRANARIIRQAVARARAHGEPVKCWRCRHLIGRAEAYDVGHRNPVGGHGLDNLAPEHRHATAACPGNRAEGATRRVHPDRTPTPRRRGALLPW